MKKFSCLVLVLIVVCFRAVADEGMWLPQLLQTLNEKDMVKMGMKVKASDIYNINKSSLKDAIVSFGGFCTAEVVSDKGLLLTNHHCGFDAIQNHSTLEHNYIRDGFWAYNYDQELPNPTLYATFIVRIEEVTAAVLKNVGRELSDKERQSLVDKNINAFKPTVVKESYQDILIKPMFEGNKYYMFITETYRDIRLVGAPPSSIGNFGKDTDNWMWPRHTGDFSMFRIYAGKDNKPAPYSTENVPYKPKRSLSISLDGMKEGDFTMVFGFPGKTTEYLPSSSVKEIMDVTDPAKINIRGKALEVLDGFMRRDETIKIKYAEKYAKIENAYKKWKGEIIGLTAKNALGRKTAFETEFMKRVEANPQSKSNYALLLVDLDKANKQLSPIAFARDHYTEIIPRIELLTVAAQLNSLVTAFAKDEATYNKLKPDVAKRIDSIFKEYDERVDKQLFAALMPVYAEKQEPVYVSSVLKELMRGQSIEEVANTLYKNTAFGSELKVKNLLNDDAEDVVDQIKNDIAAVLQNSIARTYASAVTSGLPELQGNINRLQRDYMQAQMEVFSEKRMYPDANSTLRVTYGNVKGYTPKDGVKYDAYTYMDGLMEKYLPGDYEFDLPAKLIDLYRKKDFGPYAVNGKQPVCFIASNHTTGGNSGSPALDAYGNLVGLNFDRAWEGTMSDINYDSSICRNIMVDIRYVLFIVDKFAGAKNLISELKLVHPKQAAIKPKR